jgi:hypothetical protein
MTKSQALNELTLMRQQLGEVFNNLSRKQDAAEEALNSPEGSSERRLFLTLTDLASSRAELWDAVYKLANAVDHLAEYLEFLCGKPD